MGSGDDRANVDDCVVLPLNQVGQHCVRDGLMKCYKWYQSVMVLWTHMSQLKNDTIVYRSKMYICMYDL
jgi:hypothetical protein